MVAVGKLILDVLPVMVRRIVAVALLPSQLVTVGSEVVQRRRWSVALLGEREGCKATWPSSIEAVRAVVSKAMLVQGIGRFCPTFL